MSRPFALTLLLILLAALPATAQTFDATRYGLVDDSTVNNLDAIERTLDAAVKGRQPGQWAVAEFPARTIGYQGILRITADSLEIRGAGGAVLTRDTVRVGDNAGTVYYPVRRADRVTPGAPVTVFKVLPNSFEPDDRGRVSPTRWIVWNKAQEGTALRLRLTDLVMDGNLAGNLDDLLALERDPTKGYTIFIQDGTGHAGLVANGHDRIQMCADGDRIIPIPGRRAIRQQGNQVGTLVDVRNVVVTGFGSGGFIGNKCTRWRLTNVRAAYTPFNHPLYHADGGLAPEDQDPAPFDGGPLSDWGGWENVTFAGSSWSAVASQAGVLARNVVVEDVTPNPTYRSNTHVFGVRYGTVQVEGYTDAANGALRLFKDDGGTIRLNADADVTPPDSALTLPGGPQRPPVVVPQPPREPTDDLEALRRQIEALRAVLNDTAEELADAQQDARISREEADTAREQAASARANVDLLAESLAGTERERDVARADAVQAERAAEAERARLATLVQALRAALAAVER